MDVHQLPVLENFTHDMCGSAQPVSAGSSGDLGNVFTITTEDWDSATRQLERFRINFKCFTCEAHAKYY